MRVAVIGAFGGVLAMTESGDQVNCLFGIVRERCCHFDINGARAPRAAFMVGDANVSERLGKGRQRGAHANTSYRGRLGEGRRGVEGA